MTFATLTVAIRDNTLGGFPLELVEADGTTTRGLMPLSELTAGNWTVALDSNAGPAPSDIAHTVANTLGGADRLLVPWLDIGDKLFSLLFPPGPMRDRWPTIRDSSVPLYLRTEGEMLARLPWELARSPQPIRRLGTNHALTRLGAASKSNAVYSEWPLRILIVIGCTEKEARDLKVLEERTLIENAFLRMRRSVDIDVLWNPVRGKGDASLALESLQKRAEEWHPHILHFAGHAAPDIATGLIGLQISREKDNRTWVWDSQAIQADLPDWKWAPFFVLLNACRTGAEIAGSWSLQRAFMSAGTQAVVTMQADVRGDLAGLFAGNLYEKIAEGETVQEAVRVARQAVLNSTADAQLDWALPSLIAASPELKLFTPLDGRNDPEYLDCAEFEEGRFYANCRVGRRTLTNWMLPARPRANGSLPQNVLLVTGASSSGKSHLLKWCMETWALKEMRVRYIGLHDGKRKGFLDILAQIRDGDDAGRPEMKFLHEALPPAAFKRFNWEWKNRVETGRPGTWDEAAHAHEADIPDGGGRKFLANGETRPEPAVCKALIDALNLVAAERPLILVFDQLGGPRQSRLVEPDAFRALVDYLFTPIAAAAGSRVKLVICATPEEWTDYSLRRLDDRHCLTYEHHHKESPTELIDVADEMFQRQATALVQSIGTPILAAQSVPGGPPSIARLGLIRYAILQILPNLNNDVRRPR